jgi:hypothetical protein
MLCPHPAWQDSCVNLAGGASCHMGVLSWVKRLSEGSVVALAGRVPASGLCRAGVKGTLPGPPSREDRLQESLWLCHDCEPVDVRLAFSVGGPSSQSV